MKKTSFMKITIKLLKTINKDKNIQYIDLRSELKSQNYQISVRQHQLNYIFKIMK